MHFRMYTLVPKISIHQQVFMNFLTLRHIYNVYAGFNIKSKQQRIKTKAKYNQKKRKQKSLQIKIVFQTF